MKRLAISLLTTIILSTCLVCVAETPHARPASAATPPCILFSLGDSQMTPGGLRQPSDVAFSPDDSSLYVLDSLNHRVQRWTANGEFSLAFGSQGSFDGQFNDPRRIAVASDGTVYVADTWNYRIQRFTPDGIYIGSWGGWGENPGQFTELVGLDTAPDSRVLVTNSSFLWRNIEIFTPEGTLQTYWTTSPSSSGALVYPYGLGVASDGSLYIADFGGDAIQHYTVTGAHVTGWGTSGDAPGELDHPADVQVASDGSVLVADTGNHRIQRFTPTGNLITTWPLGEASDDSSDWQWGLGLDSRDTVAVANRTANRIETYSLTGTLLDSLGQSGSKYQPAPDDLSIAPDGSLFGINSQANLAFHLTSLGELLTSWGSPGTNPGQFNMPTAVASATDGSVYVFDSGNRRVQHFTATGAYLGSWGESGSGPGGFSQLADIEVGIDGTVFVADGIHLRVQCFDSEGTLLSSWGGAGTSPGKFSSLSDIQVMADGTLWVADTFNDRLQHLQPTGAFIEEWTGERYPFIRASSAAVSPEGLIYLTDTFRHLIRTYDLTGTLQCEWGTHGGGETEFYNPSRLVVDDQGTLYVMDGNHRLQVFGTTPLNDWYAAYYDNPWLTGVATAITLETAIDLPCGQAADLPQTHDDPFGARWQRSVYCAQAGEYQFWLQSSGGVRLWVDGRMVLEHPSSSLGVRILRQTLSAGWHRIALEYYHWSGQTQMQMSWSPAPTNFLYLPIAAREAD